MRNPSGRRELAIRVSMAVGGVETSRASISRRRALNLDRAALEWREIRVRQAPVIRR